MSQFDFSTIDPNAKSGTQLAVDLNNWRDALHSGHRGAARPAYAQGGMLWVRETSAEQWDLMCYDGDTDFVLRSVNPTTNQLIAIPQSAVAGLMELEGKAAELEGKAAELEGKAAELEGKAAELADSLQGLAASRGFRLIKTTAASPAWAKSGAALITAQALAYTLAGAAHELPPGTAITLPALASGNDYAIYATVDGRLVADLNWSAPSGEPAGTTRKIGGFHVALTGEILEYSLWDINYRPTCPDPRGMVCINGMFWADIYLLGVNHHADGTSRAGVVIADGDRPPKIPAIYGGNGSAAYAELTWFIAQDVLQSHGKRLPSWGELSMLAFGVTEATSVGTDPVTTKHDAPRRSRWGVEQATGNLWVWGADVNGTSATGTTTWQAITGGRGSIYTHSLRAVLLGAAWASGAYSGSRSAFWSHSPSYSGSDIGGRGLSDHLCLLAER